MCVCMYIWCFFSSLGEKLNVGFFFILGGKKETSILTSIFNYLKQKNVIIV